MKYEAPGPGDWTYAQAMGTGAFPGEFLKGLVKER